MRSLFGLVCVGHDPCLISFRFFAGDITLRLRFPLLRLPFLCQFLIAFDGADNLFGFPFEVLDDSFDSFLRP